MEPVEAKIKWYCVEGCKSQSECKYAIPLDRNCPYNYEATGGEYDWKGEGPPPASWYVGATKVYRSYSDHYNQ